MTYFHSAAVAVALIFITQLSYPDPAQSGAIADLENMTGQTIDRSVPKSTPVPSRAPKSVNRSEYKNRSSIVKKPSASSVATMNALTTGMMIFDILNAMDAADAAQAEAAQAMAEAEHQRLIEQQRQERLISAEHLRNFWDGRDREISESLDDVFSVPGQGQGTAFFGTQLNPAVKPSYVSAGQGENTPLVTKGEIATPPISGTRTPIVGAPSMQPLSEPLTTETSSLQDGILKSGAAYADDMAKDTVRDIIKDMIKGALPTRARNAELMVEHVDKMNEFTSNLFQTIEPQRLVGTIVNGSPDDYQSIMKGLNRVTRQGAAVGLGEIPFSDTELETGFSMLNGDRITDAQKKELLASRFKGFLSSKLKDRLTAGWM